MHACMQRTDDLWLRRRGCSFIHSLDKVTKSKVVLFLLPDKCNALALYIDQGRDSPNSYQDFIRILLHGSTTRLFSILQDFPDR
jgi:hypothetical protein